MPSQKDKQIALLKSGLLNRLGKQRSESDLDVTEQILIDSGKYIVSSLQENLKANGVGETSSLYQSISYTVNAEGSFIILQILLNNYYIYLDKGVKGKKSGSSKGGFAYKTKMPPLSAFAGPQGWIARKGIKTLAGITVNAKTNRSAAFVVQRSVFNKGIKSTDFHSAVVTPNLFDAIQDAILEQTITAFNITIEKK